MSNIALSRIKKQLEASKKVEAQSALPETPVEEAKVETPIQPEELKNLFMSEMEETPKPSANTSHIDFNGIEEFVLWYLPRREQFSENQITALTSLVQSREAINVGCSCKRQQRTTQANQYYRNFWLNNQNTDLPAKVLEVGALTSANFLVDGYLFLSIPLPTPENV